jgi:ribosomal protein S3
LDSIISKRKIEVDDILPNSVSITTARPGLLIGKRGINIDALTHYLGTKVKIIEEKDPLSSWLIPYRPGKTWSKA